MAQNYADIESLSGDAKILAEAQVRYRQCVEWEGYADTLYEDDLKFAEGDSDNGYQWPQAVSDQRADRPSLTINKVRQHNLQIINEGKLNKQGIKYRAVSDDATAKGAEVFEGIARHIEYISNASDAYDTARSFQVKAGIGYCRIVTDYEHEKSFNQEIFIKPIPNPRNVRIDPDIQQKDGSDARFGFISAKWPRDKFRIQHPKYADMVASSSSFDRNDESDWQDQNHVWLTEYYRIKEVEYTLLGIPNPKTGEVDIIRKSELPKEVLDKIIKTQGRPTERKASDYSLEWFLFVGNEIADREELPGKYIPIIRWIGEETVINGVLDRKGHTRALKDAQRMFNYNASASVEYGALQTKTPYKAPAAAIEGFEDYWKDANTQNLSVLIWNHIDDQGNAIPSPEREQPPQASQLYLEGMQSSDNWMMMASGQYEANLGRKSNEVSGKAIDAREHQGDDATQHYNDHEAMAIRYIGRIILDMIPHYYDTKRIKKILAEDGTQTDVMIDPDASQSHQTMQTGDEDNVIEQIIFNPNVGKYDVVADTGPSYITKRLETYNALTHIITQSPEALNLLGDMWAENSDFAQSDKVAERLRLMLPEQAKGGPSKEMQALQHQTQVLGKELEKTIQEVAKKDLMIERLKADKSVDNYNAITKRLAEIEKHIVSPKDNAKMLHEMMVNEQTSSHAMNQAEHAQSIAPQETDEPAQS